MTRATQLVHAVGIGITLCALWGCSGQQNAAIKEKPTTPVARTWKPGGLPGIIADLETFLRRQDLDRSKRAQAMFRLAALKEDQARERMDAGGALQLEPTIQMYTQIIREFPEFELIPAIHYFLGHALVDSGRYDEGQHVFRALVCHNHFKFAPPSDPKAAYAPPRLPQDHDAAFWAAWEGRHPLPVDRSPLRALGLGGDEMTFVNPYPQDCVPMPQKTPPGEAPKYIGEVWWRMGDHHFMDIDSFGGPYNFNRAVVAYRHAIREGNSLIRTLAMYKLAWTFFKQQRYEAAVEQFIELLRQVDAEQGKTGDAAPDLRNEAYTYIAGSLTYVDFKGPGPDDPFIVREDVLDTEKDPKVAEQKMHVAIDRVRDGKIIPQNETWTSAIYAALMMEFRELLQYRNMIELGELFLSKWPNDARAPEIQRDLAEARKRIGQTRGL